MSELHEMMPAFHRELVKEAAPFAGIGRRILQSRRLGGFGAGGGAGAALGAAGGAATEGTQAYQEARQAGAGGGQAALHALGRGVGGAAKGALLGAGVGAAAGAIRPGALANLPGRGDMLGAASRFGQRQVHGLTGWTPKGGIQSIRGGAWQTKKNVADLEKRVAAGKSSPKLQKELDRARKAQASSEKAEQMGLTSIPGYAKSFVKRPGETVRAGLREKWDASGPVGRGLVFGFPAATIGGELVRPSEPGEAGRLERASRNIGDIAYAMAPLPIMSEMALGTALSAAGGQTGKILSRKRKQQANKHAPAPPTLDPAGGDAVPGESIVTDRAMNSGVSA